MDDVIPIRVMDEEEGKQLISYLTSLEVWVTPFVIEQGGSYYVKASMSRKDLEEALVYVRQN